MITKNLDPRYFKDVVEGRKTCEGRPGSKVADINVGDEIKFVCGGESVVVKVTKKLPYKDFGCAFDVHGKSLMDVVDRNVAITEYNKFPNYPALIAESGATVLEFTLLQKGPK